MSIQALQSRSWNGTPISRRTTDGYVNATAMCKANGKRWSDFRESAATNSYMEALSRKTGIPVYDLSVSKQGNGTWVHQDLATELARWISPDFSVFVNQWFREEYERQVSQVRDTQIVLRDPLERMQLAIALLKDVDGLDDYAQMVLRDSILNTVVAAADSAKHLLSPDSSLTLSEYLLELGCPAHKATKLATRLGREVKRLYHAQNGRDPKTAVQLVGGRRCQVARYERAWISTLESDLRLSLAEAT